jgi:hypothetical protein
LQRPPPRGPREPAPARAHGSRARSAPVCDLAGDHLADHKHHRERASDDQPPQHRRLLGAALAGAQEALVLALAQEADGVCARRAQRGERARRCSGTSGGQQRPMLL